MLEDIWKVLLKDTEFFENYREHFRSEFLKLLERGKPTLITTKGLLPLVDKLYILLFSFQKNPLGELFNLTYRLAHHEIDLKKAITKPFLKMIREYIDYLMQKEGDYERIKSLITLIDIYLEEIERAYSKYVGELREEIERKEKRIVKGERQAIANFLSKLSSEGHRDISVIIFYKEMPVVCKSEIIHIEDLFVRLKTHHIKAFSIGDEVYMKHRKIPHTIASRVTNINAYDFKIEVEIIGFMDPPQDKRQYVRVEPEEPIPVKISRGDWETTGTMADISVGGVGLYVKDKNALKRFDRVKVAFSLRRGNIESEGSVRYIEKLEASYRIGIRYELNMMQEEIVNDYIMERQFEILKELKD